MVEDKESLAMLTTRRKVPIMTIVLNVPEDIAKDLGTGDLSRIALESIALEGYRSRHLSEEQVRRMLSFETRFDVHAFLKQHNVYLDYSRQDLEDDLAKAIRYA